MTEREEEELSSRTDFSIVLSSRRKRPSLFLGPARFANHDCDSNAKLMTTGPHGIHIVACKDIAVGEEITVVYGLDYFGEDNCECLCATCESHKRNGWDPRGPVLHDDTSDEDDDSEESTGTGSRQAQIGVKVEAASPRRNLLPKVSKKRKLGDLSESGEPSLNADGTVKRARGRPRKHPRLAPTESALPLQKTTINVRQKSRGEDSLYDFPGPEDSILATTRCPKPGSYPPVVDTLLKRVINMLDRYSDRSDGNRNKQQPGSVAEPISLAEDENTDTENIEPAPNSKGRLKPLSERYAQSGHGSQTPPKRDSLASSPVDARDSSRSPRESTMKSHLDVTKPNKLPSIKKERSSSNLRVVTNAGDTQVSQVNHSLQIDSHDGLHQSRRGRGRPRKHPKCDEVNSSAASPAGTDDSSANAPCDSSTTSVEFTPGAIAEGICQLLTSSDDPDADAQLDPSTKPSDSTVGKSSASPSVDNVIEGKKAPGKGSSREDHSAQSAGAVQSIEEEKDAKLDDAGVEEKEPRRGPARTPKDYTLCRALLTSVYHRWVECRNCDEYFVQDNAYQTRIACPRCERHSKLYGYHWPKTDKEGKHDTQKRILDHRLIHRFVDPEEERAEKKGRKSLNDIVRERAESERQQSEEQNGSDSGIGRHFRSSPRRSQSRRQSAMRAAK